MVKLDILSDPICPWCYIGKARLDAALAERPAHPFEIEWHPFMLNPEMPAEGYERRAYLEAKFGGPDGYARAYAPLRQAAQETGLNIRFDEIPRVPNTTDAHRLIHWAGLEGRQTAMVAALFTAYFEELRDIGDPEVLADLADGIEMDAALVRRLLATQEDVEMVRQRDAHARARGVDGVPCFVVDQRHAVPGAQPAALWLQVIDEIDGHATPAGDAT